MNPATCLADNLEDPPIMNLKSLKPTAYLIAILATSLSSMAASTRGTLSIGPDPTGTFFEVSIFVFIKNESTTPLLVPTDGYTYQIERTEQKKVANVKATLKQRQTIKEENMPFADRDLRIVRLEKDEVAAIQMNFEFNELELYDFYNVTVTLDESMAKRYNFTPGVYECQTNLPGLANPRKSSEETN